MKHLTGLAQGNSIYFFCTIGAEKVGAAEGAIFTGVTPETYFYRVNAVALKICRNSIAFLLRMRYNEIRDGFAVSNIIRAPLKTMFLEAEVWGEAPHIALLLFAEKQKGRFLEVPINKRSML